jgi:MFS family permease
MSTQLPATVTKQAKFNRRLYLPMVLGAVLNPISSSMIAVTLIPIGHYYGVGPSSTAWLVSGLYLATSIGQPVAGRLIDAFGARRIFLVATALAGVAGLAGIFAPNLGALIAVRIVLGLATCAGYPSAMHLIRREADRIDLKSPATALAVLSIAGQTTVVIGPTIGGLLVGLAGWRAVFAINVPLAIICVAAGFFVLPRERTRSDKRFTMDVPGIALFAAAVVTLLLFLVTPHWSTWYLLVIGVASLVAFIWREARTADPFIDVRLLRSTPALSLTYLRALLSGIFGYSFLYGFTQWLEGGAKFSATEAGLLLLPMSLLALIVTTLTGRRPEIRGKMLVGAAAQLVAAILMLTATPSSPIFLIVLVTMAAGIPQGLLNLANQNALFAVAPPDRTASSAGLLRTFLYLGAIVSSATNGALLGPDASTSGMHGIGWMLMGVAVAFALLTVFDRGLRTATLQKGTTT